MVRSCGSILVLKLSEPVLDHGDAGVRAGDVPDDHEVLIIVADAVSDG